MTTDAPNFQYVEDEPAVSGDRGTAALVVRKDIGATVADTDGDYSLLQVDSSGNLRVTGTVEISTLPEPVDVNVVSSVAVTVNEPVAVTLDEPIDVNVVSSVEVEVKNDSGNPVPTTETGAVSFDAAATSTVTGVAAIVASVASRKGVIFQNVGIANIRLGPIGVTATTGMLLRPGDTVIFTYPDVMTGAVYAIREGAVNGTLFAMQLV